jgi:hypothetical protein
VKLSAYFGAAAESVWRLCSGVNVFTVIETAPDHLGAVDNSSIIFGSKSLILGIGLACHVIRLHTLALHVPYRP